jgi:YcxB-like protein
MVELSPNEPAQLRVHGRVAQLHVREMNAVVQGRMCQQRSAVRRYGQLAIVVAVLLVLVTFGNWLNGRAGIKPGGFPMPEMALMAFVVGWITFLWFAVSDGRWMVSHYMRDGGWVIGERSFAIGPDGIAVEGTHSRVFYKWAIFEQVTETPNAVLAWTDPGIALILPKAAIGDATAVERVISRIEAAMATAAAP